jgi:hypothetical protein
MTYTNGYIVLEETCDNIVRTQRRSRESSKPETRVRCLYEIQSVDETNILRFSQE